MSYQSGAVANNSINTNFIVGGINGEVGYVAQRSGAAFLKLYIELFVEV
ncbi:MAG: hypothetical protein ACI9FG_001284 [Crocinitomicaceae bacterium]